MPHLPFDFVIPRRPVSVQTRIRANLQIWIDFVRNEARVYAAGDAPLAEMDLAVSLVYVSKEDPADIDNIIKPILDGLVSVVYEDDSQILHVQSSLLDISADVDITDFPMFLQAAVADGEDAVYVRVSRAKAIKEYL